MTLRPNGYMPRLIDDELPLMLKSFGAVSIEGPRWCGKTWTAENHANSETKIASMEGPVPVRDIVRNDPRIALEGEKPHLIDEWQEIPLLWDTVRNAVDETRYKGQFILTGSSIPRRGEYIHSGTGRIGKIRMRTMTLLESGDSDGTVSLRGLFEGGLKTRDCGSVSLDHLIDLCIRGGWPGEIGTGSDPGLSARDYIAHASENASMMDGKRRNEKKIRMMIRSLARNESTLASTTKIMSDMREYDNENIARETYDEYWDCLFRMHLINDLPSFSPNLRSDARIGKNPKRHLTDVSLAIASLNLNHEMLRNDLNTFGLLFESLCEHDLQIYVEHNGGHLFHYRDGRGREIDAIVEMSDGRWGAFEIKLGAGQIDSAAENLLKLDRFFREEGCPPSILCVVCGMTTYAYRRPDGVYVVPITSLAP